MSPQTQVRAAIAAAIAAFIQEERKLPLRTVRPSPWKLAGRLEMMARRDPRYGERRWR